MPIPVIKEIAESTNISSKELEGIWSKAVLEAETKGIKNKYAYAMAVLSKIKKSKAMDSESSRYIDANGCLICPNSVITGEDVAEYYGRDIPSSDKLGLDLGNKYRVYRPIAEIIDNDFNGKHLLSKHIGDYSSETYEKYKIYQIGTVYDSKQEGDQIKATISFWSPKAIDDLEDGKKYVSAGYWYDPVMETGSSKDGQMYDIRMTNIRANHVAHVSNPRYKRAVVGDSDNDKFIRNAKIISVVKGRMHQAFI